MSNVVDLVALLRAERQRARAEKRAHADFARWLRGRQRARAEKRVVVRLLEDVTIGAVRIEAGITVAMAPALAREMIAKGLARPAGNTR